jgi:hypothetical protein
MFDERLSHEKQAAQIHIQYEIVVRFGYVPKTGAAFDAGIVDQNIDFAELEDGLFDEPLAIGEFGDVSLDGNGFRAVAAQAQSRIFCFRFIGEITDRNGGAFLDEALSDAETDALIATSDGDHFALQTVGHDTLPKAQIRKQSFVRGDQSYPMELGLSQDSMIHGGRTADQFSRACGPA